MKVFGRFFQFLADYKWQMAMFMAVSTAGVWMEAVRPYWLKRILDGAESHDQAAIFFYLGCFGVSIIGGNLLGALSNFCGDFIKIPMSKDIRKLIFKKVLDLDFAYHVDKNPDH